MTTPHVRGIPGSRWWNFRHKKRRKPSWWRRWWKAFVAVCKDIDFRDGLVFSGLLLLSIGVGAIRWPIGFIVFGVGLFIIGYFGLPNLDIPEPEPPKPVVKRDRRA